MTRAIDTPSPKRFLYSTYGLVLASELELPELTPATGGTPDVEVKWATLPAPAEEDGDSGGGVDLTAERCRLTIEGVASYLITDGQRILVDRLISPASGQPAEMDGVRLFLLGSAFGALLHQRRWLPLHVSALLTPSGVWAFTGPSGIGKSTLAAWLHHREGWPVVSDDVAVLKPDDSVPYLYRGPTRLKLWQETLTQLGIDSRNLVRDLLRFDKYHLNVPENFVSAPHPLHALVILDHAGESEEPSLEPLDGTKAFQAMMATIYRPTLGLQFRAPWQLLQDCARPLSQIKVYRYRRRRSLDALDANLEPLLREIKQGAAHDTAGQLTDAQV